MKGAEETADLNPMKNFISVQLKKPKADPLKKPKMDMRPATEEKNRIQLINGEMNPRRAKRPRPKHCHMWSRA